MTRMRLLREAAVAFAVLTAITGVLYPFAILGAGRLLFPGAAPESEWIGQPFHSDRYFWGRPSATAPNPYNAASSGASNLSPYSATERRAVAERVQALRASDPGRNEPIPVDLVTASASGLDPHISPAAAEWQAPRVARVRGISIERVRALIAVNTAPRWLGVLGEPAVHVLRLNRSLDAH